jgi:hypothetical protein
MKDNIKNSIGSFIENKIYGELNDITNKISLIASAVPRSNMSQETGAAVDKIWREITIQLSNKDDAILLDEKIKEML